MATKWKFAAGKVRSLRSSGPIRSKLVGERRPVGVESEAYAREPKDIECALKLFGKLPKRKGQRPVLPRIAGSRRCCRRATGVTDPGYNISHQSPITENQGLTAGAVARHGALRSALDSAEAARLEPVSQLE